jgi:multisubunit Na+/H+ antiporter MnhB subunit
MAMDEAAVTQPPVPGRPAADAAIRRLLWIPAGSPKLDADDTSRIFSTSMALSGMRCMFTYMLMPILAPALGAVVGPAIGIPLALVALVFDVRGIRTFWRVDHPQRWLMTVLYLVVMGWLAYLVIRDIAQVHA